MPKFVFIFFVLITIIGCDPSDRRLKITNKSDKLVYFFICRDTTMSEIDPPSVYYAYKIENNDTIWADDWESFLRKKESKFYSLQMTTWERAINEYQGQKAHVYIIAEDIIQNYDWDSIRYNNIYSKRFDLGINELKKNNWEVVYE